ncbi:hypothetical protein V5F77_02720 [Xanthobacter sp. DSM 24535]|uniref:hypothetical protein n=1 Tax=Roseixanthobacter psychrophilus TaxID=3119917 RepID=UPI00372A1F73
MSPRHSCMGPNEISYSFWLVFDAAGSMRFSRGEPSVSRDERAMACTATLPRSLFSTPTLKATIGISDAVPSAFHIDVEAAGAALRQVVGCDIDLQVIRHEERDTDV